MSLRRAAIKASITGGFGPAVAAAGAQMEAALTGSVRAGAVSLRDALRSQMASNLAGKAAGMSKVIVAQVWPGAGKASMAPAGMVYIREPKMRPIIAAHEAGATIRSPVGWWLAIPLPTAGHFGGSKRITPAQWEQRTGGRLQMVYQSRRRAYLVADARVDTRGRAQTRKGRHAGQVQGTVVPIFVLVPAARLPRRLDWRSPAEAEVRALPGRIQASLTKGG
ncbi:DUF6441 family protein [Tistrella bauzanensis]|uniref:DUF6441 family protein n=1 Tax=Tistrella TaxID=171436 RepID=UPI0031F6A288